MQSKKKIHTFITSIKWATMATREDSLASEQIIQAAHLEVLLNKLIIDRRLGDLCSLSFFVQAVLKHSLGSICLVQLYSTMVIWRAISVGWMSSIDLMVLVGRIEAGGGSLKTMVLDLAATPEFVLVSRVVFSDGPSFPLAEILSMNWTYSAKRTESSSKSWKCSAVHFFKYPPILVKKSWWVYLVRQCFDNASTMLQQCFDNASYLSFSVEFSSYLSKPLTSSRNTFLGSAKPR